MHTGEITLWRLLEPRELGKNTSLERTQSSGTHTLEYARYVRECARAACVRARADNLTHSIPRARALQQNTRSLAHEPRLECVFEHVIFM